MTSSADGPRWSFVLYTAGHGASMHRAEANLRRLCDRYVKGDYTIQVIDVQNPEVEIPGDVLAVPVVIRIHPTPERRVIGDLSQERKAVDFLGLEEATSSLPPGDRNG